MIWYYTFTFKIEHESFTTVSEIIDNYIDYKHEYWWHSRSKHQWWRKFELARPKVISENHHINQINLKLLGIFKIRQIQNIFFNKEKGVIESKGKNIFGRNIQSHWKIYSIGDNHSVAKVRYETEIPVVLNFLEKPIKTYWTRLRNKVWFEDAVMMERRTKLMNLGFDSNGVFPNVESKLTDIDLVKDCASAIFL